MASTPIRRLAWCTDLHFNFCSKGRREEFYESIAREHPDALLVGGDIAEAPSLEDHLREMEKALQLPIFFVLGNHDFYRGTIRTVEERVRALVRGSAYLHWLPDAGVVELTPETGLLGHGGWADGRYGDYFGSRVELNDYTFIGDFLGLDLAERLSRLHALGDEARAWLERKLPEALERFPRVIVLTHVPPFQEAAWHEGKMSSPDYLPHFSCKAVGDVLLETMRPRPDREMLVLCGHTHGSGALEVLPNLRVITGGATYREPKLQKVIDLREAWFIKE